MNVYLQSLGCRLNQSELERLASRFAAAGHVAVDNPARADVCVVNTCAVTAEAERKSRHHARTLARTNPQASIAIIGCYATLAPQRCAVLPGVAWVLPNAEKERTVEIVTEAAPPSTHLPAPAPGLEGSGHREEGVRPGRLRTQDGVPPVPSIILASDSPE